MPDHGGEFVRAWTRVLGVPVGWTPGPGVRQSGSLLGLHKGTCLFGDGQGIQRFWNITEYSRPRTG